MNATERRQKLNQLIEIGLAIPAPVWTSLDLDILPTELRAWEWGAALWDRPARSTWPYNDHDLDIAQISWDKSSTFVANANQMASERTALAAAQQVERDTAYAAERQTATDALTGELKAAYLSQPGTSEDSFKKALPAMLERRAQENTLASIGRAKSPISRSQMF